MLSEKVCIVTGGGRGIGSATAVELSKRGATVVVNDLAPAEDGAGPAEETADEIREHGGEAMVHYGDITSLEYTEELIDDTVSEYGAVDGIVNFAGILRDGMLFNMSGDEWDTVIQVHLRGHFSLLRNSARHWRALAKEQGGELDTQRSFLAVSSTAAFGNVGQSNYAAAKAGIQGLVRTAAMELHQYNVRVNTLMPLAWTRMYEDVPEDRLPFTKEEMPPEKVAPLVGYLMSDEAQDVTGTTLRAKGDAISHVSEPVEDRIAFKGGGWTIEDIADEIHGTLGQGVELTNLSGAPEA